ncbi:hypothetical protein [Streptomyces luteireticuli]|uniref:DUF7848 domain-containing protein n=1 Tax=Streptomyces luteireticuli TaxID=173858 RepID=UPI003557D97F
MSRHLWFEDWTTIQDPNTAAEYAAFCTEEGCGARFIIKDGQAEAERWIFHHTRDTGHLHFWQTFGHAIVVGTPPGAVLASTLAAEHQRAEADRPPNWPPLEPARGTATLGKP